MDLYVEKQCVDMIKAGEARQFLMLFDAFFDNVYKFVRRRISDNKEVEHIVRLTFLDALSKALETPTDIGYITWLYLLARPRVWNFIDKNGQNIIQGLLVKSVEYPTFDDSDDGLSEKAENMFKKLSLEEREIMRLKFFEEVADGDVMSILDVEEGSIGPRIYRVLKRAHFLLFGESDEKQGVYFGELSSFLGQVRALESIDIPPAFKLSLKADLVAKIDRKDFAVDSELVKEKTAREQELQKIQEERQKVVSGSNDPAKVFVEAVKDMGQDEILRRYKEKKREKQWQSLVELFERWRGVFALIPLTVFVVVVGIFVYTLVAGGGVKRGYPTICEVPVEFEGKFTVGDKMHLNKNVSDRLCAYFELSSLRISKVDSGVVEVFVDTDSWKLEYKFVRKNKDWRIHKYARALNSNRESGQV